MTGRTERAPRSVVISFALGCLGAVAFATCYVLGLGTQAYAACIGGTLCLIALGLAIWSKLIERAEPDYVEPREVGPSSDKEFNELTEALTSQPVPRSGVLWGMFGVAVTTLGAALLFPIRSLYPSGVSPKQLLEHSPWKAGQYAVTEDGEHIRPTDLEYGEFLTVFPEGYDIRQSAGATLLIRVPPDEIRLPRARRDWPAEGVLAYSKLCTHAGCPVGLYNDEAHQLLCPCHHSIFTVLDGARPVEGPASHPLPQLPLGTDRDGYLVATGPFSGPVGAAWWGPK